MMRIRLESRERKKSVATSNYSTSFKDISRSPASSSRNSYLVHWFVNTQEEVIVCDLWENLEVL